MQIPLVAYAVRERLAQTCTRKRSLKFCSRHSNYVLLFAKILLKLFSSAKENSDGTRGKLSVPQQGEGDR